MTDKLNQALQDVEMTYSELVQIANEMTAPLFTPINELVSGLSEHVNVLTVDQIRENILVLQLKAFELSEIKEKSALKADLASAIQKEKYAVSFNGMDGAATVKDKLATVAVADAIVTEVLYNLVANLFKTKLDQLHRLVDSLKSVLMSRMQEAKFMNVGISAEIPGLTKVSPGNYAGTDTF